jgi:hypothetical protein
MAGVYYRQGPPKLEGELQATIFSGALAVYSPL